MRGFVPTPDHVVDEMVCGLFRDRPPRLQSTILDPGCGTGAFIEGIVRWCQARGHPIPRILGIEMDPVRAREARHKVGHIDSVTIEVGDFLTGRDARFDYIVGNPPYVSITALSVGERRSYRQRYHTATGRFDLYLLFFEQALRMLKPGGRLLFITPEKFLYVRTAAPLRKAMAPLTVEAIHLIDEATFEGLTTYPAITSIVNRPSAADTRVVLRDGTIRNVRLPGDGSSWLPAANGGASTDLAYSLADVCVRISCGVATGADSVYVTKTRDLTKALRPFAYPTVAGREIGPDGGLRISHSMLVPYSRDGVLLPEERLGALGVYLAHPQRRRKLLGRTCVARKPWYAFHETPPLGDILRPKILCKDITARPFFVVDESGHLVPRHSVYYLVPKDASRVQELCDYLNGAATEQWLRAHCQRAANGYVRLQSHVLKRLPVPAEFATGAQLRWPDLGRVSA